MTAYYNEIDKYAAQWLRNLIAAGHIAPGDVDERDIRDVRPDDIRGYTQCHFFAGIGVWSYALRRAGWPDDRPVWTGSCPCQPFSSAGKGAGFADERHLWPALFHLVSECRPAVVFGEQVASKDGLAWIDLVLADLEGARYAGGAFDLCAAGFGAPHIRQRLYWLADANGAGLQPWREGRATRGHGAAAQPDRRFGLLADADVTVVEQSAGPRARPGSAQGSGTRSQPERSGDTCGLDDTVGDGRRARGHHHAEHDRLVPDAASGPGGLADAKAGGRRELGGAVEQGQVRHANGGGDASRELAYPDGGHASAERQQRGGQQRQQQEDGRIGALADPGNGQFSEPGRRPQKRNGHGSDRSNAPAGPTNGFWRDPDWLFCRDGKWRPVRPGSFPLASGLAGRVGRLRAYGNAIVAAQAEAFIAAYLDTEHLRLRDGIFG